MDQERQKLMDSLYRHCQVRTRTSRQVFDEVVKDLTIYGTAHIVDQCLEIIRPYKNTGINLEGTVDALYALMFPKKLEQKGTDETSTKTDGNWDPYMP